MSNNSNTVQPSVVYKYLSADKAIEVLPENGNDMLRANHRSNSIHFFRKALLLFTFNPRAIRVTP